jgi:hypothetical protein
MPSEGPPLSEMPPLRDRSLKVRSVVESSTVRHDELGRKLPKTYGSGGIEVGCMAPCSCGRYFYFTGDRVVVWRTTPDDDAPQPT